MKKPVADTKEWNLQQVKRTVVTSAPWVANHCAPAPFPKATEEWISCLSTLSLIQVNTMQTRTVVLVFFRGFTHLERLTFATNYFMAFKIDYQKTKFHGTIEYVKLTWWLGTFPQWLGFLLLPSLLSKLKLCFVLLEIKSPPKHNSHFFRLLGSLCISHDTEEDDACLFLDMFILRLKKKSETFRFTNVVHSSFNRNNAFYE